MVFNLVALLFIYPLEYTDAFTIMGIPNWGTVPLSGVGQIFCKESLGSYWMYIAIFEILLDHTQGLICFVSCFVTARSKVHGWCVVQIFLDWSTVLRKAIS